MIESEVLLSHEVYRDCRALVIVYIITNLLSSIAKDMARVVNQLIPT